MEVEIKAKVKNLEPIKKKLKEINASFEKSKKQLDIYFLDSGRDPGIFKIGDFIVRIRNCEKGKFLTYKEITPKRGCWKEYETKIENLEEMSKILQGIGVKELFRLHKNRISGKIEKFSFNLDNVKELGNFIEIELISGNPDKAQKEITTLFKKLGIKENKLERKGYGELWQEKYGGGIKVDEQK